MVVCLPVAAITIEFEFAAAAARSAKTWAASIGSQTEAFALATTALVLLAFFAQIACNWVAASELEAMITELTPQPLADGSTDVDDDEMDVDDDSKPKFAAAAPPPPNYLPFPVKTENGTYKVEHRTLDGQSKATLAGWCSEFRLPKSGNVAILKSRLVAFSSLGEAKWGEELAPGARRSHRGPRLGSKKAPPKQSLQRRNELFVGTVLGSSNIPNPLLPMPPAAYTVDLRSKEERNMLMSWAVRITQQHPYKSSEELAAMQTEASLARTVASSSTVVPTLIPNYEQNIAQLTSTVSNIAQLTSTVSHLSQVLAAVTAGAAAPPIEAGGQDDLAVVSHALLTASATMSPGPVPQIEAIEEPQHALADSTTLQVPTGQSVFRFRMPASPLLDRGAFVATERMPRRRSFALGNGQILSFTEDEVPDPPATSFVNDIPALNTMWDDTSDHWTGHSHLVIKDQPIALEYWTKVYKYWKSEQWKGTKTQWGEWRAVVHRWRAGTPDEFWAEFSDDNGAHLPWTAIVTCLAQQRVKRDERLSKRAHREYGEEFKKFFSYRKTSTQYIMKKPSDIARRYRKIHKLPQFGPV